MVGSMNRAALTLVRANRSNQNMGGAPGLRVRRCSPNLTLPKPPGFPDPAISIESVPVRCDGCLGSRSWATGWSGSDPTPGALVRDAGRQRPPAGRWLVAAAARLPRPDRRRSPPRTGRARSARRRSRPRRNPRPAVEPRARGSPASRAARGCWCSQSSVAGISRSGSTVMAWTSSAARPAVRAASAVRDERRQHRAGMRGLQSVVGDQYDGLDRGVRLQRRGPRPVRPGRPGRRSVRTRRSSGRRTAPRRRCPGVPPGHTRQRAGPARSRVGPASRSASVTPATTAAAEEPSPRPCGIALCACSRRPGIGGRPQASVARRTARTTRCSWSSGTCPAPSPSTVISSPSASTSAATTS